MFESRGGSLWNKYSFEFFDPGEALNIIENLVGKNHTYVATYI